MKKQPGVQQLSIDGVETSSHCPLGSSRWEKMLHAPGDHTSFLASKKLLRCWNRQSMRNCWRQIFVIETLICQAPITRRIPVCARALNWLGHDLQRNHNQGAVKSSGALLAWLTTTTPSGWCSHWSAWTSPRDIWVLDSWRNHSGY